jgi:hypothetical protein
MGTARRFDPERMAAHREMLETAGLKRVSLYVSAEACRARASQRQRGESSR